ncbi:hypothetical protein VCV18_004332 [Metarhizium anisopliae]
MPRVFAVRGSPFQCRLDMMPVADTANPAADGSSQGTRQTKMKRVTVDGMQLNVDRGRNFDVLAWMTCLTICWSGL